MINQLLSHDIAYALTWTLVHSIWQITLIALLLGFVLRYASKSVAISRYLLAFSALAIVVLTALVTFTIYFNASSGDVTTIVANFTGEFLTQQADLSGPSIYDFIATYQPLIIKTWMIGSLFFFIKLIGGYGYIKRIAQQATLENGQLAKKLNKLKLKFKIHREILVKTSTAISTPMVVGYLKPVILFPVGLVNNLTGEEVAAILAHELAHIKRHDFLFNLLQSLAESIFYFHPGMWYISNSISRERENCCDDMAIHYTGNKVSYAKTLIKLQEMKLHGLQPVLAMAGRKGGFSNRIKRILDHPVQGHLMKEKMVAILLLCLTMVGFATETNDTPLLDADELDVYIIDDCPQDISEIKYYVDTIPERNNFHVKRSSKNQNMELKMEDGEIKELKIDGALIPEEEYDEVEDIIIALTPNGEREMITVFPDCGDDFGNIYYLNKNKEAVNLDSLLEDVTLRMKQFEDFQIDKFDFHVDKFDNLFIDSLRAEIDGVDISSLTLPSKIKIDSILDLLPETFPSFNDTIFTFDFNRPDVERITIWEDGVPRWRDEPIKNTERHAFRTRTSSVSDQISNELLRDRLVDKNSVSQVELSGKKLKINGEKQPSNIWKKYKDIYEEATGLKLTKRSKVEIEINPASLQKDKMPRRFSTE